MDWDGTTSLTRGGWTDVMIEVFAESLPLLAGEDAASIRTFSRDELMKLNGRPSIHQMSRLADLIAERGGTALSADAYQRDYQARIGRVVNSRLAKIRSGEALPDTLLSASSLLRMPFETGEDLASKMEFLRLKGFSIVATSSHAPITLDKAKLRKKVALIMGNEGAGTGATYLDMADAVVKIPLKNKVESLNVGVAHGILSYQLIHGRTT